MTTRYTNEHGHLPRAGSGRAKICIEGLLEPKNELGLIRNEI